MTKARAWCRVDFAGGTLDIWPLGLLHPGSRTVNLAVDLEVTVEIAALAAGYRVTQGGVVLEGSSLEELGASAGAVLPALIGRELGLPPFAAHLASASPQGGGLGASSALTVAFIAAAEIHFGLTPSSVAGRARMARDLEARLMHLPTGIQDHYPAQLGGVVEIELRPGGEVVRSLRTNLTALGDSLVIAYSGQSHFSAQQNWGVVRRRLDGDPEVSSLLARIAGIAQQAVQALAVDDFRELGQLMSEEWEARRQLAPGVSVPILEELLSSATAAGAWGGKACGAGGGGCVAVLCPPDRKPQVVAELERHGGRVLAARPAIGVLKVEQSS
jgi:D-glycero-alpha-D-manno-heptose-7-phosphate kinase